MVAQDFAIPALDPQAFLSLLARLRPGCIRAAKVVDSVKRIGGAGKQARGCNVEQSSSFREVVMIYRSLIATVALLAALGFGAVGAQAQDMSKYPDWSGQWRRGETGPNRFDPAKPGPGRAQQAPLTPEYQKVFEAGLADQAAGGQGNNLTYRCIPGGMPRLMTANQGMEFVITPTVTYVMFTANMPRRIYTDGRAFPADEEPAFAGYSIGKWVDTDGDGKYDVLEVETRNFKGPRTFEGSGIPMHEDNQTIVRERIYLDKSNPAIIRNDITTIDHALTAPWTVNKTYRRLPKVRWVESSCAEGNTHVVIGKENYYVSADGMLMPARKDQSPPDLRYFNQAAK
jgi:hypothetical protein